MGEWGSVVQRNRARVGLVPRQSRVAPYGRGLLEAGILVLVQEAFAEGGAQEADELAVENGHGLHFRNGIEPAGIVLNKFVNTNEPGGEEGEVACAFKGDGQRGTGAIGRVAFTVVLDDVLRHGFQHFD